MRDSGRLSDNLDSPTHKIECDRKLKEEKIHARKEGKGEGGERDEGKEEEEEVSPSVERIDTYYARI